MREISAPYLGNTSHKLNMHIHSNLREKLNRTFQNQNPKPAINQEHNYISRQAYKARVSCLIWMLARGAEEIMA